MKNKLESRLGEHWKKMNAWLYKSQLANALAVLIRTHFFQAIGCIRRLFQELYLQFSFKQCTERIAIGELGILETTDTFFVRCY